MPASGLANGPPTTCDIRSAVQPPIQRDQLPLESRQSIFHSSTCISGRQSALASTCRSISVIRSARTRYTASVPEINGMVTRAAITVLPGRRLAVFGGLRRGTRASARCPRFPRRVAPRRSRIGKSEDDGGGSRRIWRRFLHRATIALPRDAGRTVTGAASSATSRRAPSGARAGRAPRPS